MKKQQDIENIDSNTTNNRRITSPFSTCNLVSKINSLTLGTRNKSLTNPQSKTFTNEKYITLDYKSLIDGLNNINPIESLYDF